MTAPRMLYTRADRKSALAQLGVAQRTIAKELKVDVGLVCMVIKGTRRNGPDAKRVMHHIAEMIGAPVKIVFPGYGIDCRYKENRAA